MLFVGIFLLCGSISAQSIFNTPMMHRAIGQKGNM